MDLNKLRPVKILHQAREKVLNDFFCDEFLIEEDLEDLDLHAGALCLYAATLMTKIYETMPELIERDSKDREKELAGLIKKDPRYSSLTEEGVSEKVQEMIVRDIRNSFAHGNFEISYSPYTKRMYFVLMPRRKDFVSSQPIVISKESLFKANKKALEQKANTISAFGRNGMESSIRSDLSNTLKSLMMPVQMLKIAEGYLGNKKGIGQKLEVDKKRYLYTDYLMLVSKITYEQDEYYEIFGKDSNIFERIALIRNSVAHDGFAFGNMAKQIYYTDRQKSFTEALETSVAALSVADEIKQNIINVKQKGASADSIEQLTERLKEVFDFCFEENKNYDDGFLKKTKENLEKDFEV